MQMSLNGTYTIDGFFLYPDSTSLTRDKLGMPIHCIDLMIFALHVFVRSLPMHNCLSLDFQNMQKQPLFKVV